MSTTLASKRGSFNKHPDFNKKILVVDDEAAILQTLRYNLERSGYEVVTAGDGRSAIAMAQDEEPDLIVLDIMLPVLDGMEACKEIRKTSSVPIIMLTAKDQEIDKVLALELGADDYVTKPFALHEFLARVKARLRRPTPAKADRDQAIVLGGIVLDPSRQHVTVRGKEVALAPKEFALLRVLMENHGRVVTRQTLLDKVWCRPLERARSKPKIAAAARFAKRKRLVRRSMMAPSGSARTSASKRSSCRASSRSSRSGCGSGDTRDRLNQRMTSTP